MSLAQQDHDSARAIISALAAMGAEEARLQLGSLVREHNKSGASMWAKSDLLPVLDRFYEDDPNYVWLRKLLTKKPVRSLSGITSITVLTKPFPCPGKCVFCPVDVRMPKSYIASEPGAQRAGRLGFDPYQQAADRLRVLDQLGHPVSKIELIVLGGSWSAYPREYQRWFIMRLFDALNDFGINHDEATHAYPTDWADHITDSETYNQHINASQYVEAAYEEAATQDELDAAHTRNEMANSRCVGLSLETRPDLIDVEECVNLRSLGATKIQIGIQSMDDRVLRLNKRGHKVAKAEQALMLLRRFGFKIQAHWMPNLYGSTAASDIEDYDRLFDNLAIRPDELKVYPTALIENTELETIANKGLWQAYEPEDLHRVLTHVVTNTPEYCRLSRIIRDIPSFEILAGNKKGNLRQIVEGSVGDAAMHDIRAREIKDETVPAVELVLDEVLYDTANSQEQFLQYIRPSDRKLAGFIRLSLPTEDMDAQLGVEALVGAAIIREVHVYGQSTVVGDEGAASQHQGLGRLLVTEACRRAAAAGYARIAVISAVGTRKYYEKLGFSPAHLYQTRTLA